MISVIMPSYNRAPFIEEAIESVLRQTYTNLELFVIDDGSTDNTREVVEKYRHCLHYIHQHNQGASAARNLGIRLSKGEFIAFLDSDDRWLPEKLHKQMQVFARYPSTGMAGCGEHCIDVHGRRYWTGYAPPCVSLNGLRIRCTAMGGASRAVLRRKCFDVVGLFDESLRFNEDWDMWLRIAAHFEIRNAVEPLVEWRRHNTPRPHRTKQLRLESTRKVIERHMPSRTDRYRAYSWMHFESAWISFHWERQRVESLRQIFLSLLFSRHRVCHEQKRALLLLECILPESTVGQLVKWKSKIREIAKHETKTHPVP